MYECPICETECTHYTTRCTICDFFDPDGIARPIATKEKAEYRDETMITPHRRLCELFIAICIFFEYCRSRKPDVK